MRAALKAIAGRPYKDAISRSTELATQLPACRRICRLLDVGCGDGAFTMQFARAVDARELYGIEIVDEARRVAEPRGIRCVGIDLNVGPWPYDDSFFDLILSSHNIEHVHNTRLYLKECYRCLAGGGELILLTCNLASWMNIGSLLLGWQPFSTTPINGWRLGNPLMWLSPWEDNDAFYEKYQTTGISGLAGHVRVLAYRGLCDMLKKVGFDECKVFTRGYLPFWGRISNFLCRLDPAHGHFLVARAVKR